MTFMSDAADRSTESLSADDAGSYPFGPEGATAQWDGQAWQPPRIVTPQQTELKYRRTVLPFLGHLWFWLVFLGTGYTVAALLFTESNPSVTGLVSLPGFVAALTGAVLLLSRHLYPPSQAPYFVVLWWGIMAGTAAFVISLLVELAVDLSVDSPAVLLGLQAGLIEETSKLLFPVLMLRLGTSRFGSPRLGVLLVAATGATFGAAEATLYLANASAEELWTLAPRTLGEMSHVLWTATAAAVVWLAAWRRKKVITLAGLIGWGLAVAMHAGNDAVFVQLSRVGTEGSGFTTFDLMAQLAIVGGWIALIGLVVVVWFLLSRIAIRELVPPSLIEVSSRGWRPRLRSWGS